ncbi:MAG: Intracellular proteinase inhibitor [Verrucomicrobiota bacterium]|jgi:hypothetical protein
MKRCLALWLIALACAAAIAQDETPTAAPDERSTSSEGAASDTAMPNAPETSRETPAAKRSWFGRVLHPFGGGAPAQQEVRNPRLRGLVLNLEIVPQPLKLSEVRQLSVKFTATNKGKKAVNMDFPNEQRIEIYLLNSADVVLTKWSENRVFKDKPSTLLINPQEQIEYNEKISTRELAPDKVYSIEVFFPKYPELRVRQKFLTAP